MCEAYDELVDGAIPRKRFREQVLAALEGNRRWNQAAGANRAHRERSLRSTSRRTPRWCGASIIHRICHRLSSWVHRRPEGDLQPRLGRVARTMRLNDEQRAAIDHDASTVVLAGPGSGKTHLLVEKVCILLKDKVSQPQGVACLTYNTDAGERVR